MASNFGFPAYGGTEKKVFISYKKVDEVRVASIARELYNRGINIWYDEAGGEGLKLGTKWEETIAENMEMSSVVISFISRAFFTTQGYMRTEFDIAHKDRKLLIVFLDDISYSDIDIADRPLWTQINSYQCLPASDSTAGQVAVELLEPVYRFFEQDRRDLVKVRNTIARQRSQRSSSPVYRNYASSDQYASWFGRNRITLAVMAAFAVVVISAVAIIVAGGSGGIVDPPAGGTPQSTSTSGKTTTTKPTTTTTEAPIPSFEVGDVVTLGKFNQDNDSSNGREDIDWMVIDVDSEKALLLSVYALDIRPFYAQIRRETWANSDIRDWLNNDFYDSAFTSAEKAMILETTISNGSNWQYGTSSGGSTRDSVFLLSADEAEQYLTQRQRRAIPSQYIKDKGGWSEDHCWWWLRTAGDDTIKAVYVDEYGDIGMKGNYIYDDICVRPAIYISID